MPTDNSDSSSVSSPSSDSDDAVAGQAVEEAGQAVEQEPAEPEAPEDPTPIDEQVDGGMRAAQTGDQRSVYMWTWAHTNRPGRAKPADFTRQGFVDAVVEAYTRSGKTWDM